MVLEYKNYKLRKPVSEDASGFMEICKDPEVMKYYGEEGVCKTPEAARGQIKWCLDEHERNAGRWIIVEKDKDAYIGDIGFFNFQERNKKAEIGFRLKREYWNKGIISAFIGQLLDWGFNDLGYNRIEALVEPENSASQRVLEKNGFIVEGTLREYEFEHGAYVDLNMLSILKKDRS